MLWHEFTRLIRGMREQLVSASVAVGVAVASFCSTQLARALVDAAAAPVPPLALIAFSTSWMSLFLLALPFLGGAAPPPAPPPAAEQREQTKGRHELPHAHGDAPASLPAAQGEGAAVSVWRLVPIFYLLWMASNGAPPLLFSRTCGVDCRCRRFFSSRLPRGGAGRCRRFFPFASAAGRCLGTVAR
jgi:hypothetical protein